MKKIAVLGPEKTYCDIACKKYLKQTKDAYEIEYYPSILKTARAVDENTLAILPFENTLDGFVLESMDEIIEKKYHIISQIKLDIDFAFVSNAKDIKDVKKCFVQFKAYGQCLEFISKNNFTILTTQSNIESLNQLLAADDTYGAIVPLHILEDIHFNIEIKHIADSRMNETRFFVVQKDEKENEYKENLEASFVITSIVDRPGILFDILKNFHDLNINLKSLMSRPMKTEMGKYRFYIECSLLKKDIKMLDKLENKFKEQKDFKVHILGIYNKL